MFVLAELGNFRKKYILFSSQTSTFNNDIALLRLSKEVTLSECARPIQLPLSLSGDLAGLDVIVAGWGSTTSYSKSLVTDFCHNVSTYSK